MFDIPIVNDPGPQGCWYGLRGDSLGLALAEAAHRDRRRTIVVVSEDARSAQRLCDQLEFFLGRTGTVPWLLLPDWECLPYDNVSPHQFLISQRLRALYRLPTLTPGIAVVPAASLIQRLPPRSFVDGHTFSLRIGAVLNVEALRGKLHNAGYQFVSQVVAPGEFSIRGGIIDLFPGGSEQPYRIDLLDDEIESIRIFDPESQRTVSRTDGLEMLPAREFPLDEQAIADFRRAFRRAFSGDPQRYAVYRDVSKGIAPPGIEFYLPLFFPHMQTLFDYLPSESLFVLTPQARDTIEKLNAEARDRYEIAHADEDRPALRPEAVFCPASEVDERLHRHPSLQIAPFSDSSAGFGFATARAPEVTVNPRADSPYRAFWDFVDGFAGRVLMITESPGRRENLVGLFREQGKTLTVYDGWSEFLDATQPFGIVVARLAHGFILPEHRLAIVTEADLYGHRVLQKRRRSSGGLDPESVIKTLAELNPGDPVVHTDHGVGRYRGLQTLSIEGALTEFLTIEYYGGDKLYVPVLSLDVVGRYVGANAETAPWHRLGSDAWLKAKQRARERAYDVAVELLEIQALRNARVGNAFPATDDDAYQAFSASFPFEETADQQHAIDEVLADMESSKPMDRLICGDVGFGKTEIAMRAAFIAVDAGAQVALLVPTTLLAQQHHQNFADRFADLPVKIELMSRFRSANALTHTAAGLEDGTVDIVIGTHRLLQKDIKFKNLGLLIIDEEHRFGVRQKETLKRLRSQVDVLTLTATPIPRTLNIALAGLRDISVIATPPRSRLSIKTFVREWSNPILREAVLREIRRGGQVYFLHNEVRTIGKMYERLAKIVPEVEIRTAHGQMPEKELEAVMRDFYHQRFQVLLCTTIIESGIDIPTANTIFIHRADRFGLAQLHQLRGRVGRSHHQAYAYLLIPDKKTLTGDALKRLLAIESLEDLGVGFALASHDLEIRGAGELLGESQSGLIDEVGFSLYTEYLNQAVAALREQRGEPGTNVVAARQHTEINLNFPALFPELYLPDVHLRLILYKRLATVRDRAELDDIKAEVIDRFGPLPEPGENLFKIAGLRLEIGPLDVERIEIGPSGGRVRFRENPRIDPGTVLQLITGDPSRYRMKDPHTLTIRADLQEPEQRLEAAISIIQHLK